MSGNVLEFLCADVNAQVVQFGQNGPVPLAAALLHGSELRVQFGVVRVYAIAQNMHRVLPERGADFHAAYHREPGFLAVSQQFGHAGHGIVVGQGQSFQPPGQRHGHQLFGGEVAVRIG